MMMKVQVRMLSPDRTVALLNKTRNKISDTMEASMSEVQVPTNLGPSRAEHLLSVHLEEHSLTGEVLKVALRCTGNLAVHPVHLQTSSSCKSLSLSSFLSSNPPVSLCSRI